MATGQAHITAAMQHLAKLAPGGTPNASELALFLTWLNYMLNQWEMERLQGFTRTVSVSGRSTTEAVSGSIVTQTEIGGTEVIVVTPVSVAIYANLAVDNSYPQGWNLAIELNLAIIIAPALGVMLPPDNPLYARAAEAKSAITPPQPPPKPTS